MALRLNIVTIACLLALCSKVTVARSLLGVAPGVEHGIRSIRMSPNKGASDIGSACHLDVSFAGNSKYQRAPCESLEVIAEAVEVIYAFAAGIEPAQVAVDRVGCNKEGVTMTVAFSRSLSNSTLSTLVSGRPLPLMASTLSPFGLTLKGAKMVS